MDWAIIDSGNGVSPDQHKPFQEKMLTYCELDH